MHPDLPGTLLQLRANPELLNEVRAILAAETRISGLNPDAPTSIPAPSTTAAPSTVSTTSTAVAPPTISTTSTLASSSAVASTSSSTNDIFLNFSRKKRKHSPCETPKAKKPKPFSRDLYLCKRKSQLMPYKENELNSWGDRGYVRTGVEFDRNANALEIQTKIREVFSKKLRWHDFSLFILKRQKLQKIFVNSWEDITGEFLFKNTKEGIYIRPHADIIDYPSDENSDDDDESNPQTDKLVSASSSSIVSPTDIGGSLYSTMQGSVIYDALRELRQNIASAEVCYLELDRSGIFEALCTRLEDPEFSLRQNFKISFLGEKGQGSGLLKEMLTIVLKQLKEHFLLVGSPFSKSFKNSLMHTKKFEQMGSITALCLAHGGPLPSFFSPIIFKMMFNLINEEESIPIEEVPSPHQRHLLLELSKATDMKTINELMATEDLFAYAGTYCSVTADQTIQQRDKAIADAVRFLCVTNIQTLVAAFRKGLNRDFGLFDIISCDKEVAEKIFCYQKDSEVDILSYFQISAEDRDTLTFKHFEKYLKKASSDPDKKNSVQSLLEQVTGLSAVPPLGFEGKPPRILIKPCAELTITHCLNELTLPRIQLEYDEFEAILGATLFEDKPLTNNVV